MLGNEQQPFWYSVQYDGGPTLCSYPYTGAPGTTFARLGGLDGDISVSPFGKAGAKLVIDASLPVGILGTAYILTLAFDAAVDVTKPLPLDQLLLQDSFFQVIPPSVVDGQPVTDPVRSVTPTTEP